MNIVDELHAIAAALHSAKIPYAVCGGIAVTAYGATRSTKDIDMAIAREHLAAALETVDEGRARLRGDAMSPDAFASAVAQRLDELRALDDMTRYLHHAMRSSKPPAR